MCNHQVYKLPVGGVGLLPAGAGSLAWDLPPVPAGTLFVLSERGGIYVAPTNRFTVIFGRNEPEVHVCVGAGDQRVSRQHGWLRHDGQSWIVRNTGQLPIRLPDSRLLLSGHQEPLPVAYTPLFIHSHLLEVRVTDPTPARCVGTQFDDTTIRLPIWRLTERERLVLVALGQRYLRHEPYPQPLSWSIVAEELKELQPEAGWTAKSAEHVVAAVRGRLVKRGVTGLTGDWFDQPVGNTLKHNLILAMLLSTTLAPPDLQLLV
jgi:hypothetical protein